MQGLSKYNRISVLCAFTQFCTFIQFEIVQYVLHNSCTVAFTDWYKLQNAYMWFSEQDCGDDHIPILWLCFNVVSARFGHHSGL